MGGLVILVLVAVAVTLGVLFARGTFDKYLIKYGLKGYPERPALSLDRTFNLKTLSAHLSFPQSWGADYKENVVSIYTKETGATESSQSPAGVLMRPWLLAEKENSPLADIASLWREKIQISYPGVKITNEQPTQINGKEAYYFDIIYSESKSDLSGTKNTFKARQYIIRDGKYMYQILTTSLDPLWPLYKNTLLAIAESFKSP